MYSGMLTYEHEYTCTQIILTFIYIYIYMYTYCAHKMLVLLFNTSRSFRLEPFPLCSYHSISLKHSAVTMMTWCLPFYQNAACHSKVPPTDSAWYKSMAFAIELSTEHSVIQMLRTGFGDHPVSAGLGWAEIIYAKKKRWKSKRCQSISISHWCYSLLRQLKQIVFSEQFKEI